ncbi:DinB family protein [Actinoplanes subglobosus]|uniref:DinB family protein n=1 Tax=Actinoplanes subglobosus TaxID=1547892 RepID=A0ABV8ILB4_9ACTN
MDFDWNGHLREQLDWHWRVHFRPRLDGLSDDEYLWEPVPGAWNVRPRSTGSTGMAAGGGEFTIDWETPEPSPPPVTTIAWRLGHMIVGVLGMRNAAHFGTGSTHYLSHHYAGTAAGALEQLDEAYHAWSGGVASLGAEGLERPCGPAEGGFAAEPMATLVLHINREMIHHGAEILLLRDLFLRTAR